MIGIKPHTHRDREKIIQQIIPILKGKFDDNFVALAADGSYARREDLEYSDLELIAFFKKVPVKWSYRKIVDGMLIVIVPETKESYIRKYLDISDVWYASGSGTLFPIVNPDLITEINNFKPTDVEKKCLIQIQQHWPFFQEITAKVLNTALQHDTEAMALIFSSMMKELLTLIAYLNCTPYKTLGSYISQAKQFTIKPKGFDQLLEIFIKGQYQDLDNVKHFTGEVFRVLEQIAIDRGSILYENNL